MLRFMYEKLAPWAGTTIRCKAEGSTERWGLFLLRPERMPHSPLFKHVHQLETAW